MSMTNGPQSASLSKSMIQESFQRLIIGFIAVLPILTALAGCSKRYSDVPVFSPIPMGDQTNYSVGRFKTAFIADQIDYYYRGTSNGPIGVTTVVNLDDLYSTSSFGRMYSEQLMSELAMRGFDVVEMRQSDALQFLSNSGEFALSRDISSVRNARDLAGIVVGTYVDSPERVYVNVRLIDPASSIIVSAGSIELSRTREIAKMMRNSTLPVSLERIPVRHLGNQAVPLAMFPNHVRNLYDLEESAPSYAPPPAPAALKAPVEPSFEVGPEPKAIK